MASIRLGLGLVVATSLIISCGPDPAELAKGYQVGISKVVAQPQYDAVEKGIRDEFADQKVKAIFDSQNAQGSLPMLTTIANQFKLAKKHIAIGISAPAAVALYQTINELPVLFSAVSDPMANKLVPAMTIGGGNVTGVSDMPPIAWQIKLMLWIKPTWKRVGYVSESGDASAAALAETTRLIAKDLDLTLVPLAVADGADLQRRLKDWLTKIDFIYLPRDSVVAANLAELTAAALRAKVPVFSADFESVGRAPVLLAWGFDYYRLGRATGAMAIEILKGARTTDTPPRFLTSRPYADLLVNVDLAKDLDLNLPPELLKAATVRIETVNILKQ